MCSQAVVRLQSLLIYMFSNSIFVRLIEIYDKTAAMVTSAVFNTHQDIDFTTVF